MISLQPLRQLSAGLQDLDQAELEEVRTKLMFGRHCLKCRCLQ
jgi:hypothetical protein